MRAAICVGLVAVILLAIGVGSAAVSERRFKLASETSVPEVCVADAAERERIRTILLEAMDQAFKEQLMHLYESWMKDDRGQPDRASVGAQRAFKAYLEARKRGLAFNPPMCP